MTTITNNKLTGLGANHPANGPLATERLTYVRDVLHRNLKYSNGGSMDYIIADAVKAIDELLEVRKAEPVAWMVRDIDTGEKVIRPDRSYFEGSCQPLYTAPLVPVTIDERAAFNAWNNEDNLPIAGVGAKNAAWLAWQARAKLGIPTAKASYTLNMGIVRNGVKYNTGFGMSIEPSPVVPATLPCSVELKPGLIIGKGCKTETLLTALQRRADYYAEIDAMTPEERAEHDANIEAFKAMLPQPDIEMLSSALRNAPLAPSDSQGRPRTPVVPEKKCDDDGNTTSEFDHGWNACRATMLNGGKS